MKMNVLLYPYGLCNLSAFLTSKRLIKIQSTLFSQKNDLDITVAYVYQEEAILVAQYGNVYFLRSGYANLSNMSPNSAQFDFSLRPELKRQVVLNCMDETFVHQGRSMVLIGPPGTGKTHVSISVGVKMIQLGYSVKFVMAQGLINDYVGMKDMGDRQELLNSLARADLLIIDEFGYLPHDKEAGSLFYQVISDRYEKTGTIITSNKSLRSWAEMLHDSSLATALIDRLMHHGEVFYLSGESYRLRGKKKYLEGNIPSSQSATRQLETSDCQVKTD